MGDFLTDLEYSQSLSEAELDKLYQKAFPQLLFYFRGKEDGDIQRKGVDCTVVLKSGKTLYVEEKLRRQNYGDILLEYISNDKSGAKGWAEKPQMSDYILYIIKDSKQVYVLPVPQVQAAWEEHKEQWLQEYGKVETPNKYYKSYSCPVPVHVLYNAIKNQLTFTF